MPHFFYDLSEKQPEIYRRLNLPAHGIPVLYERDICGQTSVDTTGRIEMDLPRHVIDKIKSDSVLIIFPNQQVHVKPVSDGNNRDLQLISIEIFDKQD